MFVTTKHVFCRDKDTFFKMRLLAAPANDRGKWGWGEGGKLEGGVGGVGSVHRVVFDTDGLGTRWQAMGKDSLHAVG